MAGRPRRQAMIYELEKRTRDEFDDQPDADALDYVTYRIAAGDTLKDIADSVARATKPQDATDWSVSGEMVRRYLESLHGADTTETRLSQARARSSYSLSDEAKSIADDVNEDPAAVAKARLRVQQRQWSAERFNAAAFGSKSTQNVSISVTALHLDALRAVPKEVTGSGMQTPGPGPVCQHANAQVVDAYVVTQQTQADSSHTSD
jgi:hypothetical protein